MYTIDLWNKVCKKLKTILNEDTFSRWISIIKPVDFSDDEIILSVDNDFTKMWIQDNYMQLILPVAREISGRDVSIKIDVVNINSPIESSPTPKKERVEHFAENRNSRKNQIVKKSHLIGILDSQFTFDEFVVGPSNSFAHAAALAVAQAPGRAYNPLFIYGDTGLGKTHLMQAVGNRILEQAGKSVAYVSTETFLNEYITAIQNNAPNDFRSKYRNIDLLLIDDIQFLASKKGIQEEFFHTFNALYNSRKQIIITSDRPASEIAGLEERLVSRFNAGLTTEMECPNFETRLAILRYKQAHCEKPLRSEIQTFIAENVKSNVRSLEGAMNRALSFEAISTTQLTIENLRFILRDLLEKEKQDDINLEKIQSSVAEFFDIRRTDILSTERQQSVALPRQIAMYLCRKLTHASYPEIGRAFDKTHATVLHACNTIQGRLSIEPKLLSNVRTIVEKLGIDYREIEV